MTYRTSGFLNVFTVHALVYCNFLPTSSDMVLLARVWACTMLSACLTRMLNGSPWISSPSSFELPSPSPSLHNGCVPVLCPGPWWTLLPPLRGPGNKDGNRIQHILERGCHCVNYLLPDMTACLISQRVCLSVCLVYVCGHLSVFTMECRACLWYSCL